MAPAARRGRCSLVEWYRPEITDDELDAIATTLDRTVTAMRADGLADTQSTATWTIRDPLVCIDAAAPAPAPASNVATVTSDVDVYDVPGGNGTVIGILRSNQQVHLVGSCKKDDWCNVSGPAVPGGKGWVWGALNF